MEERSLKSLNFSTHKCWCPSQLPHQTKSACKFRTNSMGGQLLPLGRQPHPQLGLINPRVANPRIAHSYSGRFFKLIGASWWRLNRRGNLNRSEVAFRGVRFISVNYKRHGAALTFLAPRSISHQKVTNQAFFHALLTGVRLWKVIYTGRWFWDFFSTRTNKFNGIVFRAPRITSISLS